MEYGWERNHPTIAMCYTPSRSVRPRQAAMGSLTISGKVYLLGNEKAFGVAYGLTSFGGNGAK